VEFYGREKGERIWERFEWHYTPKHASWLNQAEIEISLYQRGCIGKDRIGSIENDAYSLSVFQGRSKLRERTKAWNQKGEDL